MYWLDQTQSSTNSQKLFYADTESDIENLPTSKKFGVKQDYTYTDPTVEAERPVLIGSQCLVIETGDIFMLNSNNIWTKIGG